MKRVSTVSCVIVSLMTIAFATPQCQAADGIGRHLEGSGEW